MRVYFGCSMQRAEEFKGVYLGIRKQIIESGHSLTRDWLPKSFEQHAKNKTAGNRSNYYDDVMDAIIRADLVIFDCTVPSMAIGHQITFALDKAKPTLMLVDKRVQRSDDMFIAGADTPYLMRVNYEDTADAVKAVEGFLVAESLSSKIRFNLVLDKIQNDYLEWAAFKYKASKTDLIKGAIMQKINQDKNYKQS